MLRLAQGSRVQGLRPWSSWSHAAPRPDKAGGFKVEFQGQSRQSKALQSKLSPHCCPSCSHAALSTPPLPPAQNLFKKLQVVVVKSLDDGVKKKKPLRLQGANLEEERSRKPRSHALRTGERVIGALRTAPRNSATLPASWPPSAGTGALRAAAAVTNERCPPSSASEVAEALRLPSWRRCCPGTPGAFLEVEQRACSPSPQRPGRAGKGSAF